MLRRPALRCAIEPVVGGKARMTGLVGKAARGLATCVATGAVALALSPPATARVVTYTRQGVHVFFTPNGVFSVIVKVVGGRGGGEFGGLGAMVEANIATHPRTGQGSELEVVVGGDGHGAFGGY